MNARKCRLALAAALAALLAASCGDRGGEPVDSPTAPLLEGLGSHRHAIATRDPRAQRYFDQGLVLAWGFNHAEAGRSFREAARLDPACAMCWWGAALVLGPNINAAMDPADAEAARSAADDALALATTPTERAYAEALSARYAVPAPDDRTALDEAYADAMRELSRANPDDADAAVLLAEALMDLHPWDYWTAEGEPRPWTPEILETLESVLARQPDHPGAIHLYIHAVEASPDPGRAATYADRLGDLVPGAGHLVHMPSHIYLRVGRYGDAVRANQRAVAADESYATQCHAQGMYPLAYMPHNWHFLWSAATLEGRSQVALDAAREISARVDRDTMLEPGFGTLQHYVVTPLYAQVQFGRWDEILAHPAPPAGLVYPTGVWHYARGRALAATGQSDDARAELAALREIAADPSLDSVTIWDINGTADLLAIASEVLAGEIAAASGDPDGAVSHLERGAALEDALNYDEPPPWHQPVRQVLGAVLLDAGRAADAERVYRADLERRPENGWSLFGLAASLRALDRADEAAAAEERFRAAWRDADITLANSARPS